MEREMFGNNFKYQDDMLFKKRKGGNKWSCLNKNKPNNYGYIQIKFGSTHIMLHRLVYLFHHTDWNINENKNDNRIENLRIVNNSQNHQNITLRNGRPIKGVHFNKRNNRWIAQWQENKKHKSKYFKTEEESLEHRAKMVELHYTHDPLKRKENK